MKKTLLVLGTALLAVAASIVTFAQPASAAVGLHVSGRNIVEANGQTFIMRGVNHPHIWFSNQTASFATSRRSVPTPCVWCWAAASAGARPPTSPP